MEFQSAYPGGHASTAFDRPGRAAMMTDSHKSILLSVSVLITAILISMGTTFYILYRIHMEEEKVRLTLIAQSQARLLEAVARFDAAHSQAFPGGPFEATLSQFKAAHRIYKEFGKTGEFVLGRRADDRIMILLSSRQGDMDLPDAVPFDSPRAEPIRRALNGEKGCMVGPDYRGVTVLAAYEWIAEMHLGLVAKIDMREVRRPFLTAGLAAGLLAIVIAAVGALLLLKANPFFRRLVESEERYRFLVQNQNDFVVKFDPDGRLLFAGPNYLKTFSLEPDDLGTATFLATIHKEDRERFIRSLDALTRPPFETAHEGRAMTAYGWRWFEWSAKSVLDDHGSVREIISVGRDITPRKEAEKQLLITQFAVDKSKSTFFWMNPECRIVYANEHACGSLGYTRDELVGRYVWDIDPDFSPAHWAEFWPRLKQEKSITLETRHRRKDGTVFFVEVTANYIVYDGQEHDFAYARDISVRKEVEQELKQHREHLEELVSERTALAETRALQLQQLAVELSKAEDLERRRLATVLHDDIQQLLALLKMKVRILLPPDADCRTGDQTNGGFTDMRRPIEHLIDKILDKSRNLSHHLSPPILYQSGLTAALAWLAQDMENRHGLRVAVETLPGADPDSPVIASILFRSARELLFNVVKHSGTTAARITAGSEDDHHLLRVADSGKGFHPDLVRQKWRQNAGFGLFSIEDRISMLGGRMEIESAPELGCIVALIVPKSAAAKAGEGPIDLLAAPGPEPPEFPFQSSLPVPDEQDRIRIMIVDDHELLCETLTNLLEGEPDFDIVGQAHNGREAVRLAAEWKPYVILMDVSMPEVSGIEATDIIHKTAPDIRIIGLSMHQNAAMRQKMLDAGACAYLTKGGSSEELIETVRRVVSEAGSAP